MSNPWVRGEGGGDAGPPSSASGPHPGGMRPPRRPTGGRPGRQRRPGGSGGPPVWLIAAVGVVVVLAIVALVLVKVLGGNAATTAPSPTGPSSPSASSSDSLSAPASSSSAPSTGTASPSTGGTVPPPGRLGQPTSSPLPGQPANAVGVPAARAWVVVDSQWGVSQAALADEQKSGDRGSREWTYPANGGATQASYWVRAKNGVSAENSATSIVSDYGIQEPGLRIVSNQAFGCPRPARISDCWRISYVVPASGGSGSSGSPSTSGGTSGILTAYQRTDGITVITDFRALAADAAKAQAGADRMTSSLVASF